MKDQHHDAEIIHVLREALTNLVGLAEQRCGKLHEYVAALDVAKVALQLADAHAKAEGGS